MANSGHYWEEDLAFGLDSSYAIFKFKQAEKTAWFKHHTVALFNMVAQKLSKSARNFSWNNSALEIFDRISALSTFIYVITTESL